MVGGRSSRLSSRNANGSGYRVGGRRRPSHGCSTRPLASITALDAPWIGAPREVAAPHSAMLGRRPEHALHRTERGGGGRDAGRQRRRHLRPPPESHVVQGTRECQRAARALVALPGREQGSECRCRTNPFGVAGHLAEDVRRRAARSPAARRRPPPSAPAWRRRRRCQWSCTSTRVGIRGNGRARSSTSRRNTLMAPENWLMAVSASASESFRAVDAWMTRPDGNSTTRACPDAIVCSWRSGTRRSSLSARQTSSWSLSATHSARGRNRLQGSLEVRVEPDPIGVPGDGEARVAARRLASPAPSPCRPRRLQR